MELRLTMQLLRMNAGLTAQQVAQKLGVSESTVRNWDKGRTEPQLKLGQVRLLAELYQCSLDDLIAASHNSMEGK
jgi:DNA-binding XRE family transcriptional regulator